MSNVQNISFHGQTVPVFTQNNQHYVAMKPICENIGLDWSAQYQKIKRNQVLNSRIVMTTIRGEDGKPRENLCLPLGLLNGWLFGIDANRVKPEIRERLVQYQAECFEVLNAHFTRPLAPWEQPGREPSDAGLEVAVRTVSERAAQRVPVAARPQTPPRSLKRTDYGIAALMFAYGAGETFERGSAALALQSLTEVHDLLHRLTARLIYLGDRPDMERTAEADGTLFHLRQAAMEAAEQTRNPGK